MKKMMIALLIGALAAVACSKKDDAGAAASTSGASGGSIGVKECDEYVSRYEACFSKMDAIAKAAAEPAFKAQRDAFKQSAAAATTPDAKAALANSCKQAATALDSNPSCKK